ncbi:MAG: hypothetical protein SGPRY_007536, partial [Prymnesium sp.]
LTFSPHRPQLSLVLCCALSSLAALYPSLSPHLIRSLCRAQVLRRNLLHPAVAELHLLLGEVPPVRSFLRRLPWYPSVACKLSLVSLGQRPRFSHYMRYISKELPNRVVVITNQDVFLTDGWWSKLSVSLPPSTAYLLSRYHTRTSYDIRPYYRAARAEGLFNESFPRRHAATCDMSARTQWARSLCTSRNFGSYDAYVVRLPRLSRQEIALFDYPQNAWGGENVFQYLLQQGLGLHVKNPCLGLQVVHMHCELPTTFSPPKVGDRRLGKREIAVAAQARLRAMGKQITMDPSAVGTLSLNVTFD